MRSNKFFFVVLASLLTSSAAFCSNGKKTEHPRWPLSPRTSEEIETELKKILSDERASVIMEALNFAHNPNNPFPGLGSMHLYCSVHNDSQNKRLISRLKLNQKKKPSKKRKE